MIEGRLGYNHDNGRYGLLVSDLWVYEGFHCGDSLQIYHRGQWIETTFEMDWSCGRGIWYFTGTDIVGTEIEHIKARI